MSLVPPAGPGVAPVSTMRPATPLSDAALLTNAHGEPSLGAELRAELVTADEVDLLCAFVKWHGLRILESEFQDLKRRGVSLRVVTTTYMGATERTALDRLVRDFGAEVKIQYDSLRTRLHAKAGPSVAALSSTPPTSGRRTSLGQRCWRGWSGMFGSLGGKPRR